jgi:uncharacterized protein YbjT (DUF2867 family)
MTPDMRILLLGANGFIGSRLLSRLLVDSHEVRAAVRNPSRLKRRFPPVEACRVDLNHFSRPEDWHPLLVGIDAVINCAGALQSGRGQSLKAIHEHAPGALFQACLQARVGRVIHISAISANPEARTEYALTKHAADQSLKALDLDWVILRPSLVYAEGSHGGTSLLRALAAFPWITFLPGSGEQLFQPIHIDDLAETVALLIREPRLSRITLEPVGPERLTLAQIVFRLRAWLGLPPAKALPVPMPLVRVAARLGDILGTGPLNSTSIEQVIHGNAGDPAPFTTATRIQPRRMADAFMARPATAQDLWHARLYLLRPLLRFGLAMFWIWTGVVVLFLASRAEGYALLRAAGLPEGLLTPSWLAGGFLDLVLGLWLLFTTRAALVGAIMLAVTAFYLLALSLAVPELWTAPLGALPKTLMVMLLTVVLVAVAEER